MSGKIVNLKSVRKARARAEKATKSAGNAAKHGRTKAERIADSDEKNRFGAHLDGHKCETPDQT